MTLAALAAVALGLAVSAWLAVRLVDSIARNRRVTRAITPRRFALTATPPDALTPPTWQPLPSGYERKLQTANHTPTLEASVWVPALTTIGTALALTAAAGVLVWTMRWPGRVVAIVFAVSLVGAWFWRLGFADHVLWSVEAWTGKDLDGDGFEGQPPAYPVINPDRAAATVAHATDRTAADARIAALQAFAARCYLVGTSEAAHSIGAQGQGRAEYVAARDALLRLGLARWKNPHRVKSGWMLTADPELCREIIAGHAT